VAFLRAELVRAAARRRTRHRPLVALLGGLLLAGAALVALRPVPALADIELELRGDRLLVRLEDLEHRPEHIEGVLRGVGLDASVVAAPVGPSEVGRFVGTLDDARLPSEVHALDHGGATFAGFSVPRDWTGHLELRVGRPARDGEPYAVFSDALAPGEPLACRRLLGRPAGAVLSELAETTLDVRVRAGTAPLRRPGAFLEGPDAALVVHGIDAATPHQVVVRLGPPSPALATVRPPECPA
jgi:hypothetical protein